MRGESVRRRLSVGASAGPLRRGRWAAQLAAGGLVLAAALAVGLLVDPTSLGGVEAGVTSGDALRALLGKGDATARLVVWELRLPRVGLAALVGAALALAGALLQALLRNPLADPFVLGVSSGAALAAVLGLVVGVGVGGSGHPLVAGVGALAAALLVHRLARSPSGALSSERMVLAGVVCSYLFSAGIMWVVSLSPATEAHRYLFWLMGSVASASSGDVLVLGVALVAALVAGVALAPGLNLVMISEDHARDTGVDVERVKLATFVVAALVTGAAVAVAGSIGFVGLVVPHAVRLLLGADARLVVPLAAAGGGAFLVLADLLARMLGEVPIGAITATLGAPFFLVLLARRRA